MEKDNPTGLPDAPPGPQKTSRSYFTKKLEARLLEKEVEIPQSLYILMDTPFDDFSEADKEAYENRFRALVHVFVEALLEVYVSLGNPYRGWDEMSERLEPTPAKVLSKLVLSEEERLQGLADKALGMMVGDTAGDGDKKDRWWERKIF